MLNFVAAMRTSIRHEFRNESENVPSHSQNHLHSLANSFATPNSLFEIWCLKYASAFSGRVRIRIRIRSRIAATAVHSALVHSAPDHATYKRKHQQGDEEERPKQDALQ